VLNDEKEDDDDCLRSGRSVKKSRCLLWLDKKVDDAIGGRLGGIRKYLIQKRITFVHDEMIIIDPPRPFTVLSTIPNLAAK